MNNGALAPFPSLAALRAEHNRLLQLHREQGDLTPLAGQIEEFLHRGRATGAVLDGEQERWTAQSLLDYWTATLISAGPNGHTPPHDVILVDFDPTQAPELADELCPYVGLDAFREETSGVFFGRQRLAALLLEKVQTSRLLAVVGPSGSGKSSLVLAGLIPALKRGAIPATESAPASDRWRYAPRMVPGSVPLANLARVLLQAGAENATPPPQLVAEEAARLQRDPNHLVAVVGATGDRPAVLVVDQFEELFTLCADQAVRQRFAEHLLGLSQTPDQRHTVILTMRTDFESFITRLPTFQPFFEQAVVRVTPLNAAELREAIEKPAEAVGLKFEEGVVDALLQDILGEPAALPLLQFTLLKLWEGRERNRITWAAYRRLGGGRLALARSADELYNSLIPEEQVTARRILLRLVRPGEGLEVTSNRVRRQTLYEGGEARDRVDRVLNRLIAARLLRVTEGDTPTDMQVEVAHEALVRNWPRLVEWLDEERERLRERLHLTEAAEQWEKLGRDPGALLRGTLLEEALQYPDLNNLEREYVQASQAAHAAAQQAEEAARLRELEQARALAEEQRQRADTERRWGDYQAQIATRLRRRALWLTVISLLAVLLAAAAGFSGWVAQRSLEETVAQREAAEAARGVAVTQEAAALAAAETAEAAGDAAVAARQTAIAERDAGLATQVALASSLQTLLNAQATLNALLPTETPTPSNDQPIYGDTPDPDDEDTPVWSASQAMAIAGVLESYQEAQTVAETDIESVRSAAATATALPAPVATIVQIAPGSLEAVVDQSLVFEIVAFDPTVGQTNGDGIEFVEFQIVDSQGAVVYGRNEQTPAYCAFGGDTPCPAWSFADNNGVWPDGQPIQPGNYTLRAVAYGYNGVRTEVTQSIQIVR
jgi:energy-coupling factor transporter ATP-binding protein EcfA2